MFALIISDWNWWSAIFYTQFHCKIINICSYTSGYSSWLICWYHFKMKLPIQKVFLFLNFLITQNILEWPARIFFFLIQLIQKQQIFKTHHTNFYVFSGRLVNKFTSFNSNFICKIFLWRLTLVLNLVLFNEGIDLLHHKTSFFSPSWLIIMSLMITFSHWPIASKNLGNLWWNGLKYIS